MREIVDDAARLIEWVEFEGGQSLIQRFEVFGINFGERDQRVIDRYRVDEPGVTAQPVGLEPHVRIGKASHWIHDVGTSHPANYRNVFRLFSVAPEEGHQIVTGLTFDGLDQWRAPTCHL